MHTDFILEVWGELACFTRPELKVERFSYPIITPSAGRGIFEAIYWKPAIAWRIAKIEMLSPPRYIALRRNEVKDTLPNANTIMNWAMGNEAPEPLWADGTKDSLGTDQKGRTQRQTMALKNVHYRLHGQLSSWNNDAAVLNAAADQFRRRASHGKCAFQPCFGCREFPAFFRLLDSAADGPWPFPLNQDLGFMLYDVYDLAKPGRQGGDNPPAISVFKAVIKQGCLEVPPYESDLVRKPAGVY